MSDWGGSAGHYGKDGVWWYTDLNLRAQRYRGYAIIDHRNEGIYKGSDVLKLELLNGLSSSKALEVRALAGEREPLMGAEALVEGEDIAVLAEEKGISGPETLSAGSVLEISLEGLQELLNSNVAQDTGEKTPVIKRKHKRGGF